MTKQYRIAVYINYNSDLPSGYDDVGITNIATANKHWGDDYDVVSVSQSLYDFFQQNDQVFYISSDLITIIKNS